MLDESDPTVEEIHGSIAGGCGLPDSPELEREMSDAFGWDQQPTDEELEAEFAREVAAGRARWAPLPELKPVTTCVRQLDPAIWGDTAVAESEVARA